MITRSAWWRLARAMSIAAAVATTAYAPPTFAQEAPLAGSQRATRADLQNRLALLERQGATAATGKASDRIRREIAALRARLQDGDFRVGDRFVMIIRQDSIHTDTASVRDSLKVAILNLPDVSLIGVLRSELDDRISAHVARYLLNVSTRTTVLTRVAVLGAVRAPGFYYTSPDHPITDLVMMAGGPAPEANLNEFEATRGTMTFVKAKVSRRLLKEGRTLEQLDVQSGDEIRIPTKRTIRWQYVIQLLFIFNTLFFAFLQFVQWYYNRKNI